MLKTGFANRDRLEKVFTEMLFQIPLCIVDLMYLL